jgi:hypothetical protein
MDGRVGGVQQYGPAGQGSALLQEIPAGDLRSRMRLSHVIFLGVFARNETNPTCGRLYLPEARSARNFPACSEAGSRASGEGNRTLIFHLIFHL